MLRFLTDHVPVKQGSKEKTLSFISYDNTSVLVPCAFGTQCFTW